MLTEVPIFIENDVLTVVNMKFDSKNANFFIQFFVINWVIYFNN